MNTIENDGWDVLFKKQKSQSVLDNKIIKPEEINSYIFIYDCFENSIIYINQAYETLTGNSIKNFNLDFMLDHIHPDDLDYFFKCEERGLNFTNKLTFNEHFKYILSYTYRIKTSTGTFIRIQQQCQALEVNNSGHLTKTLVIHKKIEDFKVRPIDDYKIFDKSQNIYIDEENCYNLSKRELEVLNLIKLGMNSQQVSEALNVSKNTIITHRKNILTKTNSNSFIELIKKISASPF